MEFNSAFKGLMKLEFSRRIVEKYSSTKFHENSSSGAESFHTQRQPDTTKLILAFRNLANAPKM